MHGLALVNASDELPVDFGRLECVAGRLRAEFSSARPWQHIVIDDFLTKAAATEAAAAFPPMDPARRRLAWTLGGRSYLGSIGPGEGLIKTIFDALHSRRFVALLEAITDIDHLEPDRENIGAGFHQGSRGSYLRLHADHNTHPNDPASFRRVNVLLYLNSEWAAEWNGDLELWDRDARDCKKRIAPLFNRCAIMQVDDSAFHGYGPLRLPAARTRNALAAYYYAETPAGLQTMVPHPTILPPLANESRIAALAERVRRVLLDRAEKALGIRK
jgi:hypothetical protein